MGTDLKFVVSFAVFTFLLENVSMFQIQRVTSYTDPYNNENELDSDIRFPFIRPISNNSFPKLSLNNNRERSGRLLGINEFEVEIFVVLDRKLESVINGSYVNNVIDYVGIFFNNVNHIYKNSHPHDEDFPLISFQVAGIEVLDSKSVEKIFQPVNIDSDDDSIYDIEKVLKSMKRWAKRAEGKYDKYDHIILLTGQDLYRKVETDYEPDVLGVAYLSGACTKTTDVKYEAVSVVEDVGGFFLGVYAAVHELAHNLGVKHDSKKKTYCSPKLGHIMSPITERTSNMFTFSNCSLASLKEFLYSTRGKCLAKSQLKPVFPPDLNQKFPGNVYSMLDICEQLASLQYNGVTEITVNPNKSPSALCKQVSCKLRISSGRKIIYEPPVAPGENTKCGESGRCKSGECI